MFRIGVVNRYKRSSRMLRHRAHDQDIPVIEGVIFAGSRMYKTILFCESCKIETNRHLDRDGRRCCNICGSILLEIPKKEYRGQKSKGS